jgi:ATP/maltotriose-dependent transcriptional regulator MalT
VGEPVLGMALLADVLGNYEDAVKLARMALESAIARSDTYNQVVAYYVLSSTSYVQGEYDDARRQAEYAYALAAASDNLWMMAYIAIILGNVALACGDYVEARKYYTQGYAIQSELGNPEGMAAAQLSLAGLAAVQRNYQEAEQLFQDSYVLYREINDPGGQIRACIGLGDVAQACGNFVQACRHFHAGMELAVAIRSAPLLLAQFTPIGELLAMAGEPGLAVAAWTLVIQHTAGERAMQQRAYENLRRIAARHRAPPVAGQEAAHGDPFVVAALLRDKLAQATVALGRQVAAPARSPTADASSALIEPLSERELEVLHLMAAGMTNRQIADRLAVVVGTVKTHNHHIFGKLAVANRVQALARARSLNLL